VTEGHDRVEMDSAASGQVTGDVEHADMKLVKLSAAAIPIVRPIAVISSACLMTRVRMSLGRQEGRRLIPTPLKFVS
jgi:hypothetical protein